MGPCRQSCRALFETPVIRFAFQGFGAKVEEEMTTRWLNGAEVDPERMEPSETDQIDVCSVR